MPFGISNTIMTFLMIVNEVIRPFIDSFAVVYLDDILAYNEDFGGALNLFERSVRNYKG